MKLCSPPFGIGASWLDKHAPDICQFHDAAWMTRKWKNKFIADFKTTGIFLSRGIIFSSCGIMALPYFIILGTPYWMWKKYICRT